MLVDKSLGIAALTTPDSLYDVSRYRMPTIPIVPRDPAKDIGESVAFMMRKTISQQGHNLVVVIQEQVKLLEGTLQEGESLVVYCDAGQERIRVHTFTFPNWHLAVVNGLDDDGNRTCRIENVQDIKLTCKIVKSTERAPTIGFVLPTEKKK